MPVQKSDRNWHLWAKQDPYFGVLTDPRYRRGQLTPEARRAFFASGESYVANLLNVITRLYGPEIARRRCLDFGCGVGRLVVPLARRYQHVVGVDISPAMLAEAERNCQEFGFSNVQFELSDDKFSRVSGAFDLVNTYAVLQHLTPGRGERIFRRLAGLVGKGGIGALHVTFSSQRPAWRQWLHKARGAIPGLQVLASLNHRRAWNTPLMQMNLYDLKSIVLHLCDLHVKSVQLELTDHDGYLGALLIFRQT